MRRNSLNDSLKSVLPRTLGCSVSRRDARTRVKSPLKSRWCIDWHRDRDPIAPIAGRRERWAS